MDTAVSLNHAGQMDEMISGGQAEIRLPDRLLEEVRLRPVVSGSVEVIQWDHPQVGEWPIVPGSLLMIWTADRKTLEQVKTLADSGDSEALHALLTNAPTVAEDEVRSDGDIFDHVLAIGELRYRSKPVLTGVTVPPWISPSLDRACLPFAGGAIEARDFDTVSHVREDHLNPLTFVVVVNPISLSAEEQRIIDALDGPLSGLKVDPQATPVAAAGVVATAVAAHYVDKATDRVDRKVGRWAENRAQEQAREGREAQRQYALRQAAQRAAYRNMGIVPEAAQPHALPDAPRTLEELMRIRIESVGRAARRSFPLTET